jgi:hypothetical protein
MNLLKRTVTTLVVVTGVSLGAAITPAITAVTSKARAGSPGVFRCC